jgi:DNA-binding transcriptional LysR family regulator
MDRFDELIVFTTILNAGSLSGAARRLRRSPPSVTRSLAAIEERAGVRLVQRTTRWLAPTEAGRRLAERARRLIADYGAVMGTEDKQPKSELRGLLRVTAPTLFGRWHVTPIVMSFLDLHPGVRVELVLTNHNLDLVKEGLDVAVRIGPLTEASLVVRRAGQVRVVLLASPDYLARRGRPRTLQDLITHDIVYDSHRPSPPIWRFRSSGRDRVIRLKPRLMVSDVEAVLVATKAGAGLGRALTYQAAGDLASGALIRLLPEFEPAARPVQLVVPAARHIPPTVRAFMDHAAERLRALPVIHE